MIDDLLCFDPVYQTRVWGGRSFETRFGRRLPDGQPYGESWEISARAEADVAVKWGPWKGKRLGALWADQASRENIFGPKAPRRDGFPLLGKILDAREKLSLQVHPPERVAPALGGESKTEVWYVAAAEPGAVLYAGFRERISPALFEEAIVEGRADELVHALHPKAGEFIFIPSGRLHAIGAGLLIYEIQQNSDTTYRAYDWNRPGLDGKPRPLHVAEAMQCIDFDDVAPSMDKRKGELLCECDYFRLEEHILHPGQPLHQAARERFGIVTVVAGTLAQEQWTLREGDFFIIRHGAAHSGFAAGEQGVKLLFTTWP